MTSGLQRLNYLSEVNIFVQLLNAMFQTKKWSLSIVLLFFVVLCHAQIPITSITDKVPLPTSVTSSTTVTAPSDAINDIDANQSYMINYGTGDNLEIASYTAASIVYDNFVLPDTLAIRRTDNQPFVNIWYTLNFLSSSPYQADLDADQVSDADAIYQSGVLNAGYDNILVNDDDEGENTIQAQVERLDVIWYGGIVTCSPSTAVFPIIERGGNDQIKIAAITALDVNGEPSAYGTMIDIENSDWPDPTNAGINGGRQFSDFLILRRQSIGADPIPIANIGVIFGQSAQSLQGVAIPFSTLGVAANQVIYGFSLFAFDTNATDHTLTDIFTFPTDTKASDSGLDLVAGLSAGVSSDDCLTPANGPGGYKSSLAAWLKANVGVTTATEASTVTDWQDQWIGNHDATTGVAAPTYRSTSSNINFNPTVDFTSGSTSLTIANNTSFNTSTSYTRKALNLAFRTSTSDITTRQVIYEQGGSTRGINVYVRSGNIHLSVWNRNSDGAGSPWNNGTNVSTVSSAITTNSEYIVTLEFNGSSSTTGTVTGYLNGQSFGSLSSAGLLYADTDGIEFGASDGTSQFDDGSNASTNSFYGEISELIYCNEPGSFPLTQRNRIESYLALKYGITLNQSTPINYVNSAGSVIFNTTSSASIGGYLEYNKDIAGIGRDDNSVFEQQKSKSENTGSVVTIDKGGSFGVNNTWLIWGNDGGDLDDDETTDRPTIVDRRLQRVWRVGETGDTGANTISFDISGMTFNGGTPTASDFSLLIAGNSSGGTFTSAEIMTGATLVSNILTFTGVNLSNGEYFTLGTGFISCGPGNVTSGLSMWLRADNGPNTSTNGADVSLWADFAGSNDAEGTTNLPNLQTTAVNFNPALNFDETNTETLTGAGGFYTQAYYIVATPQNNITNTTTAYDVILGFNTPSGSTSPSATNNYGGLALGSSTAQLSGELFAHTVGASNPVRYRRGISQTNFGSSITAGTTFLFGIRDNSGATSTEMNVNGRDFANQVFFGPSNPATIITASNVPYFLGTWNLPNDAANSPFPFLGQISEVISYSARPDDTDQHSRIQSYLSIKYGITLNQTSAQNYLNSASSVIWNATDNASYNNDIAGIGRDDGSCLVQKQSKSVNSDAIVTIGLGTIATNNNANPNSFSATPSFMVWGNDNAAREEASAVNDVNDVTPDVPTGVTERMRRVWRVDETGTVGNTSVSFDLTGLGYSRIDNDFRLIVSSSTTMSAGTTIAGGTFNGDVITFNNVDFADGDYFTLGTQIEACGPGGVTSGLVLWLKANEGPDVLTDNTDITTWTDKSTANNDAIQAFTSSPGASPVNPKLKTNIFNFNPIIRFFDPGSSNLVYMETDNGNVVSDDMTISTVFATTQTGGSTTNFEDAPVFVSNGDNSGTADFGLGISAGRVHFNAISTNSSLNIRSTNTYNAGKPHIATGTRVKAASGAMNLYVDSQNVGTGTSDNVSLSGGTSIGVGNNDDATINSQLQGDIAAVIAYDRVLTATERQRVESYFAINYGITRAGDSGEEDYLAADAGVVWAWAEQSTYNYKIAGIARDDASCLLQNKTRSSSTSSVVTMEIASSFDTDDSFLIWGSQNVALEATEAQGNTEFNTSQVQSRFFREWYVQETGSVGEVDLTFDLSTTSGPSGIGTNNLNLLRLMRDADGDFTSGVTLVEPTSIDAINKTVTFRVNLVDTEFFTLGSTEKYALPITLISFEAKPKANKTVDIKWSTASESGNAFFSIERSLNGREFTPIANIQGAGDSEDVINYSFEDLFPRKGTSYYRLKQTDFNGEFEYSEVKRVVIENIDASASFNVYPNPIKNGENLNLSYSVSTTQEIEIQIVSASGILIDRSRKIIQVEEKSISLDSSKLKKGLNLIRIIDGDGNVITFKVLSQ
jgi:hypothetical protein